MKLRNALQGAADAALLNMVQRLRRNELDFDERLASRLHAVRDPDMPTSDPLYQRLYFTAKRLKVERIEAERELARRAVPA